MWIVIVTISYLLSQNCLGLNLIDLPVSSEFDMSGYTERIQRRDSNTKATTKLTTKTWQFRQMPDGGKPSIEERHKNDTIENEKDENIKSKIKTLVEQTIYDSERKIKSIEDLKLSNRDSPPYQVGVVLSLVKKSREVINELFNVAVKHRDSWQALEQLKVFELIVHTNVDTTNFVRRLVEIHMQHLNNTSSNIDRRRVVVFK